MVGGELVVHPRRCLAEADDLEPAVGVGQLLLDDVRLDRHAKVVGLACQVGRGLVVDSVLLEAGVAKVAPQDGGHAELMGGVESDRDLLQLSIRLR